MHYDPVSWIVVHIVFSTRRTSTSPYSLEHWHLGVSGLPSSNQPDADPLVLLRSDPRCGRTLFRHRWGIQSTRSSQWRLQRSWRILLLQPYLVRPALECLGLPKSSSTVTHAYSVLHHLPPQVAEYYWRSQSDLHRWLLYQGHT